MTAEHRRLQEARSGHGLWKKWGPYLSERQWGTVREDYSADGDVWESFTHDQARSRAYHWGEDGIAGLSDDKQRLCFAMALWNGQDPILKERLFGLTNREGNHGEDVKEYYFYLDNTPTHSYMRYLYKYCQQAYPYDQLVAMNRNRSRDELEYELLDTGVFEENRYFDVLIEYAKSAPEDILIRISACNRGPERASLHVLPTLWFRNTWRWWPRAPMPRLRADSPGKNARCISATHAELGRRYLWCEGTPPLLFTENETNAARLYKTENPTPFVKDAIHNAIVHSRLDAVNPARAGTKAAAHYVVDIEPGATAVFRLRLRDAKANSAGPPFGQDFNAIFDIRRNEADEFYGAVIPRGVSAEEGQVMRRALAGMLWSKQYYYFDVSKWLDEHASHPLHRLNGCARNREWFHMQNDHVISMPDKWEYPWYAAWDLAFHAVALSTVDVDFAKEQLDLMLREIYLHPSGQLPACEWNFSDVNPPVHAWATLFLYRTEQALRGDSDIEFLKRTFSKLLMNFTWWVNRKDRSGRNVFEGGCLGLDNIGVFDRSEPLPAGGSLEPADGTAWMALFSQNMGELSLELAVHDPVFVDFAHKFLQHFLWIAAAINQPGPGGMWDKEDGFYYDVMRLPDGGAMRLKVRSMLGLIPLCATTVIESWQRERVPQVAARLEARLQRTPELRAMIHPVGDGHRGVAGRTLIALVNPVQLLRILTRMLDEKEFFGAYGIRALSRQHETDPYVFRLDGSEQRVNYEPAESTSGLFGGNSNWRGPIWFPVNVLIIRALLQFYLYYGDAFKVECPTGSGNMMNLFEVSKEIARRLVKIFLRDEHGRRPVYGGAEKFQTDPHWRDLLLFYEYFNGDDGAGLGASHQTGWTGLVAKLIELFGRLDAQGALQAGKQAAFRRAEL